MSEPISTYRERAGVIVSGTVVIAMLLVGPIQLLVQVYTGQKLDFDPTWVATIASLAATAFGFLIGKQSTNQPATTTITATPATVTTTVTPETPVQQ